MNESSANAANLRPHQLAVELAGRLSPGAAIIDFGSGRGRNTAYLRARGFDVRAVADDELSSFEAAAEAHDAALSTHALLHGTPATIAAAIQALRLTLRPRAPFFATFASQSDPRFGTGIQIEALTYAPADGEERGVPHSFFLEAQVRELLRGFIVEAIEEHRAEHIEGSVHWFVRAARV